MRQTADSTIPFALEGEFSIAVVNSVIAVARSCASSGSPATPKASRFLPIKGILSDASSTTRADITLIVSVQRRLGKSCSRRRVEQCDWLSTSSPLPTIQSSAFLSAPGTPSAYSGLLISTPSDPLIRVRKLTTVAGSDPSKSGLKCGSSASPSYKVISTPGGARRAAASRRVVFDEKRRRLPEMARIRIIPSASG